MGGVFVIYLYKNVDNIPIFDFYDMPEERILKMVNQIWMEWLQISVQEK